MSDPLLKMTVAGLYCEAGQFFIDPVKPVSRAIITHAHADHARSGSREYLTARCGERVLRSRLVRHANVTTVDYGQSLDLNGVRMSLHPAGHMLGSSQVRVEHRGEIWVVSGDYKVARDPTCEAFEPLRCHTFITESTFALPHFQWPEQETVWAEIIDWWRRNRSEGRASVIYCYSVGKAQRILAGIGNSIGLIFTHGKVETATAEYRESGISLPPTEELNAIPDRKDWSEGLVLAPPQVRDGRWIRRLGLRQTAFASGWMCTQDACRNHRVDRGFVLSDHADWNELNWAIRETQADKILVTHGYVEPLVQHLVSCGINATPLVEPTR